MTEEMPRQVEFVNACVARLNRIKATQKEGVEMCFSLLLTVLRHTDTSKEEAQNLFNQVIEKYDETAEQEVFIEAAK